jgi:cytochrome b561
MSTKSHRYAAVAIVLHWAIAALIIFNLYLALRFDSLHGMAKFGSIQLHKSVGITVLLLSLARLAWRLTHSPPGFPEHMPAWEKFGASAAHWVLYILMIGIPLSGWAMVSVSPTNLKTILFKTVTWPHIGFLNRLAPDQKKAADAVLDPLHHLLGYAMLALLVVHILAALKHQFWDKDEVLGHMLPFARRKTALETR